MTLRTQALGARPLAGRELAAPARREGEADRIPARCDLHGLAVRPELHVARVRARVAKGGHDIPESRIRERYDASRLNLIRLLPSLHELWVYDNSVEADPDAGVAPEPRLVLHLRRGTIVGPRDVSLTPAWAKAIVAAAMKA